MRKRKIFFSSTNLDKDDEQISLKSLEEIKSDIDNHYIITNTNHNHLSFPNGRVIDSIIEENNGIYELYSTVQFWDKKENFKRVSRKKKLKVHKFRNDLEIECSKSFEVGHNKLLLDSMVNELKEFAPKVKYRFQKAVGLNIVLVLSGIGILSTAILNSMGKRIGNDLYDVTKNSLKKLFSKLQYEPGSKNDFLIFKQNYIHDNILREIHLIVNRPNASDIENVYQKSIVQFDRLIKSQFKKYPNIAWLVLKWEKGNIKKHYHLDFHCIPSKWDVIPDEVIEKGNTSIEGTATLVKK